MYSLPVCYMSCVEENLVSDIMEKNDHKEGQSFMNEIIRAWTAVPKTQQVQIEQLGRKMFELRPTGKGPSLCPLSKILLLLEESQREGVSPGSASLCVTFDKSLSISEPQPLLLTLKGLNEMNNLQGPLQLSCHDMVNFLSFPAKGLLPFT